MQIMTRGGWKDFSGIMEKWADNCYSIILESILNGDKRELKGSDDHRIAIVEKGKEKWKRLDEIEIGEVVETNERNEPWKIVEITKLDGMFVYSPVDVVGGSYLSEGIDNHNCSFLGSSETLISGECLDKLVSKEPVEYKYGYDMLIYELPVKGCLYVMGVDSAMGNGGDYSAIQVVKVEGKHRFRQVAQYRRNTINADDFAEVVNDISRMYNDAQYIIENNGVGASVAETLFYEIGNDCMISTDKHGDLGTKATKETKLDACRMLKKAMEKGHLEVVDTDTIDELSRFEKVAPDVFRGASGKHDDLVSALYWAVYALSQPEVDLETLKAADRSSMMQKDSDDLPPPMYMDNGMGMDLQLGMDFWRGLN